MVQEYRIERNNGVPLCFTGRHIGSGGGDGVGTVDIYQTEGDKIVVEFQIAERGISRASAYKNIRSAKRWLTAQMGLKDGEAAWRQAVAAAPELDMVERVK